MGQIGRRTLFLCWYALGLAGTLVSTDGWAQHVNYQAGPRYQPQAAQMQVANPQVVAVNRIASDRVVPIGVSGAPAGGGTAWGTTVSRAPHGHVAQQAVAGQMVAGQTVAGQTVMLTSAEQPVAQAPNALPVQPAGGAVMQPAAAPTPAWLQGTTAPGQPAPPDPIDFTAILRRLIIGTFGVLIACVASLWAARQWLTKTRTIVDNHGRIRVLDAAPLANRGTVQLIEVDGQKLLLGFDTSGLKTMLPVTEPFTSTLSELDKR